MKMQELTLDVAQQIRVNAPVTEVFEGLLRRLGEANVTPQGPMPMTLEARPGGRWMRDLGEDHGHLWGFVQVIKPPTLLEICGPMFMSYPVSGHISFRLSEVDGATELALRHQALGLIDDSHRQGVVPGWAHLLEGVKSACE